LEREGAFDRPNHRGELDQHAIAGRFDDPAAMLGNEWIGGDPMLAQHPRRAFFVLTHQTRIPGHVGGEDRG
jgi:hypothetical protein